jgi:hypothetical protein
MECKQAHRLSSHRIDYWRLQSKRRILFRAGIRVFMKTIFGAVLLTAVCCTPAMAQDTQITSAKPNFDCTKVRDVVFWVICDSREGATAYWDFTGAYWAGFFSVTELLRDDFDQRYFSTWRQSLHQTCNMRPDRTDISPLERNCVIGGIRQRAAQIKNELSGDALAEANLSPEERAAIQRAVCTENLNPDIFVMKSAEDGR